VSARPRTGDVRNDLSGDDILDIFLSENIVLGAGVTSIRTAALGIMTYNSSGLSDPSLFWLMADNPRNRGDPGSEIASRSTGGLWWSGLPYVSGPLNALNYRGRPPP
jgi:hypothetical protein